MHGVHSPARAVPGTAPQAGGLIRTRGMKLSGEPAVPTAITDPSTATAASGSAPPVRLAIYGDGIEGGGYDLTSVA